MHTNYKYKLKQNAVLNICPYWSYSKYVR